jgi:hypothetical protein
MGKKILFYSKSYIENTHTVCGKNVEYIGIRGWTGLAQSELPLATCWTVRRSNPCGGRSSAIVQPSPVAHPASYTMGTRSFPKIKRPGRSVDQPSSTEVKKKEYSYNSAPSLGLRGLFWDELCLYLHIDVLLLLFRVHLLELRF